MSPSAEPLIAIWNKEVQAYLPGKAQRISLTPSRAKALHTFVSEVLEGDTAAWKLYCIKIRSTRFLMGGSESGFRVTLDWALKLENARKILEVHFYDKSVLPQPTQHACEKSHAPSMDECAKLLRAHCTHRQFWFTVCWRLAHELGYNRFRNWFQELVPIDLKNPTIRIHASSAFHRDWILEQYDCPFKQALNFCHAGHTVVRAFGSTTTVDPVSWRGITKICTNLPMLGWLFQSAQFSKPDANFSAAFRD